MNYTFPPKPAPRLKRAPWWVKNVPEPILEHVGRCTAIVTSHLSTVCVRDIYAGSKVRDVVDSRHVLARTLMATIWYGHRAGHIPCWALTPFIGSHTIGTEIVARFLKCEASTFRVGWKSRADRLRPVVDVIMAHLSRGSALT